MRTVLWRSDKQFLKSNDISDRVEKAPISGTGNSNGRRKMFVIRHLLLRIETLQNKNNNHSPITTNLFKMKSLREIRCVNELRIWDSNY